MTENTVDIKIKTTDDSGGGFESAAAKEAAFARVVDQTTRKEIAAHGTAVKAEESHARATSLLADAERELARESGNVASETENVGKVAANSATEVSGLATPMGGLFAAGVALSPVLVTLGFGLGGLGAAAYGVISPIEKAAGKAGGLKANLGSLNSEQQTVARSILGLGKSYGAFQNALQPTVVKDFNAAIGAVKPLLHEVEPVAKATGNALAQMFGQVGAEFRSGEWQQFFGFMAQQAGPDVRQLTEFLTNLAGSLPGVMRNLQPVASEMLTMADGVSNLVRLTGQYSDRLNQMAGQSSHASGPLTSLADATKRFVMDATTGGAPEVSKLWHTIAGIGQSSASAAPQIAHAGKATGDLIHPAGTAAAGMSRLAQDARLAADAARAEAAGVAQLTNAFIKAYTPLENYIGAELNAKDAAHAAAQALRQSSDRLGDQTQKQRDSSQAVQDWVTKVQAQVQAAEAAHRSLGPAIGSLQQLIGVMQDARGKTAAQNAELQALKELLDRIRAEQNITKTITVIHRDVYSQGGKSYQEFHAAGGPTGSGNTVMNEQGAEAVHLPTGSTILSHADTLKALAASGGGQQQIVFELHSGGGGGLEQMFWTWFQSGLRIRGGDPQITQRKVVFR